MFHRGQGSNELVETSAQFGNLSLPSLELIFVFAQIYASSAILVLKNLLFEFEINDLDLKGMYVLNRQSHLSDRIFVAPKTYIKCGDIPRNTALAYWMMANAPIDHKSDNRLTNGYLFGICHISIPMETLK